MQIVQQARDEGVPLSDDEIESRLAGLDSQPMVMDVFRSILRRVGR